MSNENQLAELHKDAKTADDFMPLLGTDHIEFYCGNAKQSAYYYQSAFGYQLVAYAGLETGVKDRASYVLQQGKARLVLTTSLDPDNEISKHVKYHGDGVKVLALWVDEQADAIWNEIRMDWARFQNANRDVKELLLVIIYCPEGPTSGTVRITLGSRLMSRLRSLTDTRR